MQKNLDLLNKVTTLAKHYSMATGVGCRVMDSDGVEIYRDLTSPTGCQFCSMMRKITKSTFECLSTHEQGAKQAYELKDSYIYSCPSNFIFWSSPIIIDGSQVATIIAGSSLINSKDDYLKYDVKEQFKGAISNEALSLLKKVTSLSEERIMSLSEILILSCRSFVKLDSRDFVHQHFKDNLVLNKNVQDEFLPADYEQILLEHVANGDEAAALAALDQVMSTMMSPDTDDFHQIKNRTLRLAILLARTALENGASSDEILSINLNCLKEIHQKHNTSELSRWLVQLVKAFCDSVFKLNHLKHGEAISRAIRFGQKNFAYNISLDDVAQEACLSPSYFSRIFKEEMKVSFTEYLNSLRVEESKRLLRSGQFDLTEIAAKCGFADQSYFTKTFKKVVGISPGRFRVNYRLAAQSYL